MDVKEFLALNNNKSYQSCFDYAMASFWSNWWFEGHTYAKIVLQQTLAWCATEA